VTPRTAYYTEGLAIAKALLTGVARQLDAGGEVAWAFLIRTPEAVEAGIRTILQSSLSPDFKVEKRGLTLVPSTKTLTPDLVFGTPTATIRLAHAQGHLRRRLRHQLADRRGVHVLVHLILEDAGRLVGISALRNRSSDGRNASDLGRSLP
jgi:hypothetical protein